MKIGKKRRQLSKILSNLSGISYPPEKIRQANCTVGARSRSWMDAFYWLALPDKVGAVLASRCTMSEIIEAHKTGQRVEIRGGEEVTINDKI